MNAQNIIQQLLYHSLQNKINVANNIANNIANQNIKTKHVQFQIPDSNEKNIKFKRQFQLWKKTNINNVSCFAKDDTLLIGTENGDFYVNEDKISFENARILDCIFSKDKIIFSLIQNHELQIHCHKEGILFSVEDVDSHWPGGGLEVDKYNRLLFGVGQKREKENQGNEKIPASQVNLDIHTSIPASQVNLDTIPASQVNLDTIPASQVNLDTIPASQDNRVLYGKIARIHIHTEDNPKDNPFQKDGLGSVFRNEILHNGLRNPKRLHFDEKGYLWVTDSGNDINMNENIFKLDQPSNCRWDYYDGFELIHPPSHESVYVLNQASPHASYQSPQNENPLDVLDKIGSCATGGIVLDNEAYLFADQGQLLSLEPEINMDKVISQNNDITIHDNQSSLQFVDFVQSNIIFNHSQSQNEKGHVYKSEKNINQNNILAITKQGDIYYL